MRSHLHVLALGAALAVAGMAAWQAAACNAGCSQRIVLVVTLDGGAPGPDTCSPCSDASGSSWKGACEVIDAGPPATIACFGETCLE